MDFAKETGIGSKCVSWAVAWYGCLGEVARQAWQTLQLVRRLNESPNFPQVAHSVLA